ncbi:MAG: tRNA pseudouridine(13) synthase TruD [Candidatus Thorarchaeota archaeon]
MSTEENYTYFFDNNSEREVEKFVGIETFATQDIVGIKGDYKTQFKDFIVREIEYNGKILDIKEDYRSSTFSEELKDRYTWFNLIKVNNDTFEALRKIGNKLKTPYKLFSYSGLKDKNSISVQKISVKGNYVTALRNLKINDIFIRNVQPKRKPIKLGSHLGNHFSIVIRNVNPAKNLKNELERIIQFLNQYGFPNYFGLQRFGKYRPNSHLVGYWILQGDYQKAFEEFISSTFSTESLESEKVRREFRNTRDLQRAFREFPKSLNYERNMIEYLISNMGDYEGSINTLPSDLKKLLISSFQSYIFNKMVSLRVKKGIPLFSPVDGDVICILDDIGGNATSVKYKYGNLYDNYLDKALKLNHASIVMPIIGSDTSLDEFPLMKSLFEEIMREENIKKNLFKDKLPDEFEFKGSLRSMTIKPTSLKLVSIDQDDLNIGRCKVKIEFSLKRGSYATMLIREFIK